MAVVLFDGDGTLWDFETAMRFALAATLDELWARAPGHYDGLTIDRLVTIRDRVARELDGRVNDLTMVRLAAFERALEEDGLPDSALAAELTASFFGHLYRHLALFDETAPALDALAGHRLGLVTNGTTHPDQVGLGGVFEVVVHAADVRDAKPHPEMVDLALRRLGARPAEAILVGDSEIHDVAAGRAAGVATVLIDRSGTATASNADAVVGSLLEVPSLIGELTAGNH